MLTVLVFVLLFVAIGLLAQATLEIRRLQKQCDNVIDICQDAVKSLKDGRG